MHRPACKNVHDSTDSCRFVGTDLYPDGRLHVILDVALEVPPTQ